MATTTVRYPYELSLNKDTHYVKFEFLRFKEGGALTNTGAGGSLSEYSGENYETKFQADTLPTIMMYMPDDQGTQITAQWGGKSFTLTGIQAARTAAAGAQGTDEGGLLRGAMATAGSAYDALKQIFTTQGGKASLVSGLGATILNKIPSVGGNLSTNDILQGGTSQILNPNVEMFYDGPQLRTLGMVFRMSARSSAEAKQIEEIVKAFRMASAPGFEGNSRFIRIPSYVKMRYMVGGKDNEFLPKHKLMTILSVDVRYDNGQYAAFSDDRPLYTELSINMQESKIIFREDIEAGF
jgi:hypothetical protein